MNLNRLKVNRLTNPLGFEMNSLSFSWTVEETDAKKQQWARVEVAADESFQRLLWDSGEDAGLSSVDCPVTLDLQPRTRYWWRVTVQGRQRQPRPASAAGLVSKPPKLGEPWAGAVDCAVVLRESSVHPLLTPQLLRWRGSLARARAYAVRRSASTSCTPTGRRPGTSTWPLDCTAYDRWLQYQTYDVTAAAPPGPEHPGGHAGRPRLGRWAGLALGGYARQL